MGDLQPVDCHLVFSAIEVYEVVLIMDLIDAVRTGVRAGERLAITIQADKDVSGAGQVCRNLGRPVAMVSRRWGKS